MKAKEKIYKTFGLRDKSKICDITIDLSSGYLAPSKVMSLGLSGYYRFMFDACARSFCGIGLRMWQHPVQFSDLTILLSEFNINSFMEIGTREGGTFYVLGSLLNFGNKNCVCYSVDIYDSKFYEKLDIKFDYKIYTIDSGSIEFLDIIKSLKIIDLIFIDGDHSYRSCVSDIRNTKEYCNILIVHDIDNSFFPGVKKAWREFVQSDEEFYFLEIKDQSYVWTSRIGLNLFGIGVAIRKKWL